LTERAHDVSLFYNKRTGTISQMTGTRDRERAARTRTTQPRVRGLASTVARYSVGFDPRTVFDFLVSLSTGPKEQAELPAEDARWLRDARAALPADVRAGAFAGGDDRDGIAAEVAAIAVARPDVRDAAGLVALIETMTPTEIVRALLRRPAQDAGRIGDADIDRALAGDDERAHLVEERLAPTVDEETLASVRTMLQDPVGTAERLHLALRAWLDPFRGIEGRVREVLERDVAARRGDLDLPPAELVERTTGGIRFLPDAGIRRVVLAPSYFSRPYNWVIAGEGWRLFCYPVAETSLEARAAWEPPAATVLLYRALGDPQRLRILRMLADRDMYLTEIAQQLELSKPTAKYHLAQLRAAGLVVLTEERALTYYTLRRDRLDEAGTELRRYIP
jgi:DNA-binding transcriptional ArsR family regulator